MEQLFHAWRSFNFDENTETIDAYVTQIRQVATLLGYGELPNSRSVQKYTSHKILLDTVSNRRPKAGSRDSKKNIDQRKLDKQFTGQASTSPFMSIREGAGRRVSFDMRKH